MAHYAVNPRAVERARRADRRPPVRARQRLGRRPARAEAENAFLESPLVGRVRRVAPGPHRGRDRRTKARYAFVYGDFRRLHRIGPDRLPVPRRRVAPQGGRARRPRPAPAPRSRVRLTGARWDAAGRGDRAADRDRLAQRRRERVVLGVGRSVERVERLGEEAARRRSEDDVEHVGVRQPEIAQSVDVGLGDGGRVARHLRREVHHGYVDRVETGGAVVLDQPAHRLGVEEPIGQDRSVRGVQ